MDVSTMACTSHGHPSTSTRTNDASLPNPLPVTVIVVPAVCCAGNTDANIGVIRAVIENAQPLSGSQIAAAPLIVTCNQ